MRFDAGTTNIPTAGTRVQISNTNDRVLSVSITARAGNTGNIYLGFDDVSSTNGKELRPGETAVVEFGDGREEGGSVLFSTFYVDAATNGDDADWMVILA